MKKKHIFLLAFSIILLIVVVSVFTFPYVSSYIKREKTHNDCQEEMEKQALLYLEQNVDGFDSKQWKFIELHSEERSEIVEKHNSDHFDEYVYPFLKTEIQFVERGLFKENERWVVYFRLTDDMQQEIVGCEFITIKSWEE